MSDDKLHSRYGYTPEDPPITIREDAPEALRRAVWQFSLEARMTPPLMSQIIVEVFPDVALDYSPKASAAGELTLQMCPWFYVYEIIERVHHAMSTQWLGTHPQAFTDKLNGYFRRNGIGWQVVDGKVEIRGPEAYEVTVRAAVHALHEDGRTTAESELHEALRDLSRRPEADLTGAVTHAGAALECVARDVTGDPKKTLGDLIKEHPKLFPAPLDKIAQGVWGIASNKGRHLNEGEKPSKREALLLVGLSASIAVYLIEKG